MKKKIFFVTGGTGSIGFAVAEQLAEAEVRAYLADPPGSALHHRVAHGVLYAPEQQERTARRHRYDTIMEGVGCDRVTANFAKALVDGSFRVEDDESVAMAKHLLKEEGLFVGGSSAMNCVAAVRAARRLGPGHTIVTILCDGGQRYLNSVHASESAEEVVDQQHGQAAVDFGGAVAALAEAAGTVRVS